MSMSHADLAMEFDLDDLVGLDDQRAFLRQEQVRFEKAKRFFVAPHTIGKLLSVCHPLVRMEHIMNAGFKSARRFADSGVSIFTFLDDVTNPALRVAQQLLHDLTDEELPVWAPLRYSLGWSEYSYMLGATPVWLGIGQVFGRLVAVFRRWPWLLARLVMPTVPDNIKRAIARALLDLCEHCDPFTEKFRDGCASVDDVLSEQSLSRIRDVFEHVFCQRTSVLVCCALLIMQGFCIL